MTFEGMDWMIGWTPVDSQSESYVPRTIEVGEWPDDRTGWSKRYAKTSGCCYTALHDLPERLVAMALVTEAFQLITLEGIPVDSVMREFAKIRIWREMRFFTTMGDVCEAFGPDGQMGYDRLNPGNWDTVRQDDIRSLLLKKHGGRR